MNITIVGMGYVGLANALMLASKHNVTIYDINTKKVTDFNNGVLPLHEDIFDEYFGNNTLHICASIDENTSYENADYVIIAIPTDFNEDLKSFDTDDIENIVEHVLTINTSVKIIIKSTVPIGFTEKLIRRFNYNDIYFCPEFLREDKALTDCLNPSRIVIGGRSKEIGSIFKDCCNVDAGNILYVGNSEAEAIKLFSNAYLAMRVAFFNELDKFAIDNSLNSFDTINGVCQDKRIGNYYNNPSFGYGGYCLPKDTLQLQSQINSNSSLISCINQSNENRIKEIAEYLNKQKCSTIGVYKLEMKKNSSNFRNSAILKVLNLLENKTIIIYEPSLQTDTFETFEICTDLKQFKQKTDIIITNRNSKELQDVSYKVFTRDIYNRD